MGNIETPHLREYGFRNYPKYVCLWNPESGKFRNLGFEKRRVGVGVGEEGCKHAKKNCVIELCHTLKC